MTDQTPSAAAAATRPRAPLEINLIALVLIGVITLAEIAAYIWGGDKAALAAAAAGNAVTGLFAIINRSPVQ